MYRILYADNRSTGRETYKISNVKPGFHALKLFVGGREESLLISDPNMITVSHYRLKMMKRIIGEKAIRTMAIKIGDNIELYCGCAGSTFSNAASALDYSYTGNVVLIREN